MSSILQTVKGLFNSDESNKNKRKEPENDGVLSSPMKEAKVEPITADEMLTEAKRAWKKQRFSEEEKKRLVNAILELVREEIKDRPTARSWCIEFDDITERLFGDGQTPGREVMDYDIYDVKPMIEEKGWKVTVLAEMHGMTLSVAKPEKATIKIPTPDQFRKDANQKCEKHLTEDEKTKLMETVLQLLSKAKAKDPDNDNWIISCHPIVNALFGTKSKKRKICLCDLYAIKALFVAKGWRVNVTKVYLSFYPF